MTIRERSTLPLWMQEMLLCSLNSLSLYFNVVFPETKMGLLEVEEEWVEGGFAGCGFIDFGLEIQYGFDGIERGRGDCWILGTRIDVFWDFREQFIENTIEQLVGTSMKHEGKGRNLVLVRGEL